ncbi:hypothetical protein PoB_002167700 [Plakobranchus ocellatus]|uniref:Uncharacterized protein n=1 Tax=Plakobranchus ocellatus TaxID=259542 RepID=A0AAV3ZKR4_9GAST|nr:hypothetical protein PoB_002167700 [Plakobranchus ocellatus]
MSYSESGSQEEELRKNGSQIAIEEESQPVAARSDVEFNSDNTCGSNSKEFRNDGHEANSGDRKRNLAQSAIEETCSVTEHNSSHLDEENGNIGFSTSECECKAQTQKQKIIARDDEKAVTEQPNKSAGARSSYSPKTKPKSSFLPSLQQNPSSKSTNASRVFRKYTLNEAKNQLPRSHFGNEAHKYLQNQAPFHGRLSFASKETNQYDCGNAALKKQATLDAHAELLRNNGNSKTSGYMGHDQSTLGHFNLNHPLHSSHSKSVSSDKTSTPPAKQGSRERNVLPKKMSSSRSDTLSGASLPLSSLSTDNSTMFQFYGDVCSEESEDDAPRRLVIKESCSEQDSESDSERHGDAAFKFPNLATFLPGQNLPWQSL